MESVPITTKVVSLNPTHVQVYSIKNYVIKFVGVEGRFFSGIIGFFLSSTGTKSRNYRIFYLLLEPNPEII